MCVCAIFLLYVSQSHSVTENTSSSVIYKLFADVKEVIKEIRSDWYSLAIELDIDYDTRKVRLLPPPRSSRVSVYIPT